MNDETRPSLVLVVDDDRDIGDVVYAVLSDEGFRVSLLHHLDSDAIRVATNQLEPGCVLLDGEGAGGYGQSWEDAAWLSARARRVPVVMFSAQVEAANEVDENVSGRARAAGFAAVIRKPFDVDELVEAVYRAVGRYPAFDPSAAGESARTAAMVARARELTVRMALGARASEVLRHVLAQAARIAIGGTAIGLVAAVPASRYIRSQLYGVKPTDPTTLVGVIAVLVIASLAAAYLPARRATRVDPVIALRSD